MSSQLNSIPLHSLYEFLRPITLPAGSPHASFSNWAKTFFCRPLLVFQPETEYQCQLILELARRERKVVRAVGVGHSPSDLACTNDFMLRTEKLNRVLKVDVEKRRVIAQAGITLNDLHAVLQQHNLSMINVGSISDQTLAGIVTTATHGTGIHYGVISTHVHSLTLMLADGSRVHCSRHERPDLFMASICGLGSTGLILDVELEVEPAFRLREVQESRPFEDVMANLGQLVHSAEHTRFFWFPASDTMRISRANRTQEAKNPAGSWFWDSFMGYHAVQFLLFLGRYVQAINIWAALFASWLISSDTVGVDDSYRIFNLDCRYLQYTTEWAIPYDNAEPCLRDLREYLRKQILNPKERPHFPIEVRFSAPDDIWLSPSNGQQTCWIGIMQHKPYGFKVPYRRLFDGFEQIMSRYNGKPHWAKAHRLRPEDFRMLYPQFDKFIGVLEEVDPTGMFRNEYMQRHFWGQSIDGRVFKSAQ